MANSKEMTTLGEYLLTRLVQIGAQKIQGVPGDFNMGLLDLIEDHKVLKWVGNCNELNAAYSADGYARTAKSDQQKQEQKDQSLDSHMNRVGVVVTTFGVGELSALNGVAGCFSERIPLVHIVGVPSTEAQGNRALLHHTLGDGRFDAFEEMSRKISISLVKLGDYASDGSGAVRALDKVLAEGVKQARPVYVSLPTDLVHLQVPKESLQNPLSLQLPRNDQDAEKNCLKVILEHIENAKDPIIIVDACAIRHGVIEETLELVDASGYSVFSTPMGKSAINETHPQFGGIYVGSNTVKEIKDRVESADLLIQVGSLLSDFNTANFSYRTPRSATIGLHSNRIETGFATFEGIRMKQLMPKLSAALKSKRETRLAFTEKHLPKFDNFLPTREEEVQLGAASSDGISQAYLWPRIGQFLKSGDQLIAETGTSSFGSLSIRLPSNSLPCFHSQILWGSIGWALPACLGVSLATSEEDKKSRVVLFIGDGSFQLTAQEISTMVREGLGPIIFVLSNDGYEIERQIHGPERRYNNTARWDLKAFVETFTDVNKTSDIQSSKQKTEMKESHVKDVKQSKVRYDCVRTKDELDALLKTDELAKGVAEQGKDGQTTLRLVEIIMARGDAPKALLGQAQATQKSNSYD
ncbi:hypothetical protein L7F22_044035 [Adiantum nelumboides]|nr:hypothetical protein [Adiantum nelumboides]